MTTPLYYNDVHLGQRFLTRSQAMERDRLVAFATEFDPQPQHLGEQQAATSLFGTLVASGWHTAALTMRLQVETLFSRIPGGGVGGQVDTLAWRRPVHPGDVLRAELEIKAMRLSRSRPDRGLLTIHTTTLNQKDEVVLEMTAAVLVPRRRED